MVTLLPELLLLLLLQLLLFWCLLLLLLFPQKIRTPVQLLFGRLQEATLWCDDCSVFLSFSLSFFRSLQWRLHSVLLPEITTNL